MFCFQRAVFQFINQNGFKKLVFFLYQVYFRIKDIDAFEERHVDFADVLIPFCQATGTPMTATLIEILKESKQSESHLQVDNLKRVIL